MDTRYFLTLSLLTLGATYVTYAADLTTSLAHIPTELYPHLFTNFFNSQRDRIYTNTIPPHELVGTVQLAFKLHNIDFLAVVEMRRFFHTPTRAKPLTYGKEPVLLIDLLPLLSIGDKGHIRTNLLHHLATCITSYKPHMPFYIPKLEKSHIVDVGDHNVTFQFLKKPILRYAKKTKLFVLHDEGYSMIMRKNTHLILNHHITESYTKLACGSDPWPLVMRTASGATHCFNLTDNETLIESVPTDAELALLNRTITRSEIAVLDNGYGGAEYALPLEIEPDHYAFKAHPHYHRNKIKPTQYSFYDKKRSSIYLLTMPQHLVLGREFHIETFELPHLIRDHNGIDRLLLCAISGYKNMHCSTTNETWSTVNSLTEAILKQFNADKSQSAQDTKAALGTLIQNIHNQHLHTISPFPTATPITTEKDVYATIPLEHIDEN